MPTKRITVMKRNATNAVQHLKDADDCVAKLGVAFEEPHPELTEGLEVCCRLIYTTIETLNVFYRQAWGTDVPSPRSAEKGYSHEMEVIND